MKRNPAPGNLEKAAPKRATIEIVDADRYERLKMIGWWDQERLKRAKILVVGAGALGNEVIKNLALVGIGHVLILDFDVIESSNLSRAVLFREEHCGKSKAEVAAIMAHQLNPDCNFVGRLADVTLDVGLGLIRDMDVVICCVDNREARLWINRMCWKVSRPWVDGGIQEISGVAKTFVPPSGACYECTMTENDYRLMHLRYSCPLLKREDIQQGKVPTAPTIASLIGALQTQEALKILHQRPVGHGVGLVFNGDANQFYQTRFPVREGCLSHETYGEIHAVPLTSENATALELMSLAEKQLGWQVKSLELDRDFLRSLVCDQCAKQEVVNLALSRVSTARGTCPQCGLLRRTDTICQVSRDDESANAKLSVLGIPDFDIIRVHGENERGWILLEGDRDRIWRQDKEPKPLSNSEMAVFDVG